MAARPVAPENRAPGARRAATPIETLRAHRRPLTNFQVRKQHNTKKSRCGSMAPITATSPSEAGFTSLTLSLSPSCPSPSYLEAAAIDSLPVPAEHELDIVEIEVAAP